MWQRQCRVHFQLQSFLLRLQTRKVFQVSKETGEINRLVIKLNFTALKLIHINDIVENITQSYR
ncbi:hypothetical protein D3C75_674540 [compost metagenome]